LGIAVAWKYEIARILNRLSPRYDWPWSTNLVSVIFPVHWPQLFSVFGFLAIPMWLLRDQVTDPRLRQIWFATIPFITGVLLLGVWRETRIFGELSVLAAITFSIQLERILQARPSVAATIPPSE
jgi:hypothetical protein